MKDETTVETIYTVQYHNGTEWETVWDSEGRDASMAAAQIVGYPTNYAMACQKVVEWMSGGHKFVRMMFNSRVMLCVEDAKERAKNY